MKKMINVISSVVFVTILVVNINFALKTKGANVELNLSKVEALANSYAEYTFYCCSPYDVVCAKGDGITVWGTLSTTQCP